MCTFAPFYYALFKAWRQCCNKSEIGQCKANVCWPTFCSVFCTTGTNCTTVISFLADWACWITDGAQRWVKSLLFVVKNREPKKNEWEKKKSVESKWTIKMLLCLQFVYLQPNSSSFPFLNDKYRLLPPAGMGSYFLSCKLKAYASWLLAVFFVVCSSTTFLA